NLELHQMLEEIVPVRSKHSLAHIEISAARSKVQTGREFGMRTSNDRPVVEIHNSIAIHVLELDASRSCPTLARIGANATTPCRRVSKSVGRILEIALGY